MPCGRGMCCPWVEGRKADVRFPFPTAMGCDWGCPGCREAAGTGAAAQPGCVSAPGLAMGSIRMCLCWQQCWDAQGISGNPHLCAESTKPKAGVGQSRPCCLKKGWASPRDVCAQG